LPIFCSPTRAAIEESPMTKSYRELIRKFSIAAEKLSVVRRAKRMRVLRDDQEKSTNVWEGEGGNSASPRRAPQAFGFGVFVSADYLSFDAGGNWARTSTMDARANVQGPGAKSYSVLDVAR
jgi:hypothetical protein